MGDLLSKEGIVSLLHSTSSQNIIILETVDSTNTFAKNMARQNAPHETVVIADKQTQGRGRLGRDFFSPQGTGIYMSLLLYPDKIVISPAYLTIVAGIAVCRTLTNLCHTAPKIKWVNDVFANGKKVCGILAENIALTNSPYQNAIILGIGVNVFTKTTDFPEELRQIAASVFPKEITRNQIIASILTELHKIYMSEDVSSLITEYKGYSLILNKKISFIKDGETYSGIASDINCEGNLIVSLENGSTMVLKSGEVTLGSSNFS